MTNVAACSLLTKWAVIFIITRKIDLITTQYSVLPKLNKKVNGLVFG